MAQTRYWCFTYFGKDEDPFTKVRADFFTDYDYLVLGREICPTTNKHHLQGFVVFPNKKRLTAVVKFYHGSVCHWEKMQGTAKQASDYCKEDGDFEEWGTLPTEVGAAGGEATKRKYEETYALAKAGRIDDIPSDMQIRHYGNILKIAARHQVRPSALTELDNTWIYGPTGVGKTRQTTERYPDAYLKKCNKWWDGYVSQETAVIEELSPVHHYLANEIKVWADHNPFPAEIKGGSICIRPKRIIILSNYPPEEIFTNPSDLEPLLRRFKIIHITENLY